MIDFHTHTFASDGVLLPSELIRRALVAGYSAIGITDHADESNMEELILKAKTAAAAWAGRGLIDVIPGIEITHALPERIPEMAASAREMGAGIVVVHGETITEPVALGTNEAAVTCKDVDILAHPGLLTRDDAAAAAENGVYLEITSRKGHSAANGRVARMAMDTGAKLLISTDAHAPGDLITSTHARTILAASGLDTENVEAAFRNAEELLKSIKSR
jgi:histidinol phosphatase-like PHP family hydrolase